MSGGLKKIIREKFPRIAQTYSNARTSVLDGRRWSAMTLETRFTEIFERNRWGSGESISGEGSTLEHTAALREKLPQIIKQLSIRSMLDVPCGDFNWMRALDLGLEEYTGADIVRAIVESNQVRYGSPRVTFRQLDVTRDRLPRADLVMCRDCLMHLSNAEALAAIRNILRSGCRWLALTSFHDRRRNRDTVSGGFRALNMQQPPFRLPEPIVALDEGFPPSSRKFLDFWECEDLTGLF